MSDTPETDASRGYALSSHYGRIEGSYLQMDRSGPFVHAEVARKLERERNEAQKELSSIHRWIDRNHPDGFIDSQTYFQNLERFVDNWYDRLDRLEVDAKRFVRERDEARHKLELCMAANSDVARIAKERDEAREEINDIRLNLGADAEGYTLLHAVCAIQNERDEATTKLAELSRNIEAMNRRLREP
jgi:hypothetical protein